MQTYFVRVGPARTTITNYGSARTIITNYGSARTISQRIRAARTISWTMFCGSCSANVYYIVTPGNFGCAEHFSGKMVMQTLLQSGSFPIEVLSKLILLHVDPMCLQCFFSILLMNGFFFTHLLKHNRAIGLEWSCCSIAAVACNILLICAKLTIKNQPTNYVCQKMVSNLACNCGISFW